MAARRTASARPPFQYPRPPNLMALPTPATRLDPFGDPSARPAQAGGIGALAKAAAAALATLLALDAAWIGALGPALGVDFFKLIPAIQGGPLAARPVGLLAYAPLTAAVVRSALGPGGGWRRSAEAGLYIYSVYELTNAFCFAAWPLAAVVGDTLWGAAMFGVAGAAAAWAAGG